MLIAYERKRFSKSNLKIVEQANEIIGEYQAQGFTLTLRQLYYQFVARDLIPNTMQSYKRLGVIVNDGRMAGVINWEAIEDRTRNLQNLSHWGDPKEIIQSAIDSFRIDKWVDQAYRPEVWIEKEALTGIIANICTKYDVPYFACRGYNSQSEQWSAGRRFAYYAGKQQIPIVFHFGDHDPSGIDMTRDNQTRLSLFASMTIKVERLALNYDQIKKYNPPPNPAKTTDSRYTGYIRSFGVQSWELDALNPQVIVKLVEDAILNVRNNAQWQVSVATEEEGRAKLKQAMNLL